MATKGTSAAALVDEFVFNTDTSSITADISISEHETTNLASSATEAIPGLGTCSITLNGYFAGGAADGMADELHDRLGVTGAVVSYVVDRTSTGTSVWTIPSAYNRELPVDAPVDGVITMNGVLASSTGYYRGELVTYYTTISGTGTGTSIDLGSAGSAGGYAWLHVHSIDGSVNGTSTNSAIDIESSSDDATFASEGTFTFSATGGNSVTMSGTVNRYIRINTTSMGGASSIIVTAIVAVANVTY